MARPKKKPGYDREAEIADLIAIAAALFDVPYDDQIDRPEDAPSIVSVAEEMETTILRVRKLLITAGMYSTTTSRQVQELESQGHTIPEIMQKTGLGKASVYSYLPYKKGAYNLPDPTLYSEQGARYRARKKACEKLRENIGTDEQSVALWKTVIAFQHYPFTTAGRGKEHTGATKFKYTVSEESSRSGRHYEGESIPGFGNEMIITGHDKSISRSTVELALKNALEEQEKSGFVSGPKKLKVPGAASYLYVMFIRFGVIKAEQE